MSSFLDQLVDGARRRAAEARQRVPFDDLVGQTQRMGPPPPFASALARPGVQVIAEIKRASPSKGDLNPGISATEQAGHYVAAEVAAISVLTEPEQFKGSLDDLRDVAALGVPTLRKDFIVDPYQVWEAAAAGASAVLLIVAALDDERLANLGSTAVAAGLDVLVEVHDEAELQRATAAGARIIGVNARDLRTFEIDRDAFARLRPLFDDGVLAVAESGIRGPEDVHAAGAAGADAVLVGEALVTSDDPRAMAAGLVRAGRATVAEQDEEQA